MGTEIYSTRPVQTYGENPPETPPPSPNQGGTPQGAEQAGAQAEQGQDQAQQAQSDQAKQALKDQAAVEAQRLAQQQLFKVPEKPQSLTFEFLSAFQTIFQEGYENFKVPQASQGADVFSDQRGKELQKDLGVIREFLREAKRLVGEQKMDVAQMFHWIRTEQGGAFWQRVQQALMREGPGMAQMGEGEGLGGKTGALAGATGKEGEKEALEAMKNHSGQAMLELLKAESNPRSQMESYLLVLQMLRQDGLKDSSQKLLSYLRRRMDLSEEEMQRLVAQYGFVYFQGPMPREEKTPVNGWYFFGALLSVPTALLLGIDFLWSALIGVTLVVLVLAFFRFSGK